MSNKNLKEQEFNKEMKGLRKYLNEKFETVNSDLGEIKTDVAVLKTVSGHQQKHIDTLESKSNRWDLLNSIGIFLSGIIGALVRPDK